MYDCGASGIVPLSWSTIDSWITLMERDTLSIYDKKLIRDMSEAYVGEYNAGTDKNRMRPYIEMAERISEEEVAKNAKAFEESMMAVIKAQQGMK